MFSLVQKLLHEAQFLSKKIPAGKQLLSFPSFCVLPLILHAINSCPLRPPCIFSAKSCGGIFIPRALAPSPRRNSYTVRFKVSVVEWQGKNEARIDRTVSQSVASLFKPLGCLLLNCLPRTRTARSNDGHAAASRKFPACSPLNAEARQPTASVGSISQPRVLRSAPTPRRNSYTVGFKVCMVEWQRKNEASIHRTAKHFSIEGGRNRGKKCRIPRISPPSPPRLVLRLRLQKEGRICGTLR